MRVIIAGSREITDVSFVEDAIKSSGFDITEIVCGECRGPDLIGKEWAKKNNIKVSEYPALWDDITVENCSVKTNSWGKKYNALAGFNRNKEMAENADGLIAVWDGFSPGTKDMIDQAKKLKLKVYIHKQTHDDCESVGF